MRGVCGLCFERLCDNLLDPVIADLAWRTASRLVVDAIKAMLCEPIAPRPDVWRVTPTTPAISQLFSPSAARRMISARCASARAILRRQTRRSSTARSSALSLILLAFRFATTASESLIGSIDHAGAPVARKF